jgi:hypothetical protein
MDGDDLFALMSALGWLVGQPSFAPRADHLFHVIASAILTNRSSNDVKKATRRSAPIARAQHPDVMQRRSRPVKAPGRAPRAASTVE